MTAYPFFNGHRCKSRSHRFFLLCMSLLFFLWGCGGDSPSETATPDKVSTASTDTGSASFAIQWHAASAETASVADSAVIRQVIESCETAGVASITCTVYDGNQNAIAEGGPWDCSAHQGTIEMIPTGSNRTFSVLGWNGPDGDGRAVYQGKATGITINTGLNAVGTIDARPFVPDAPMVNNVYGNEIDLSWNDLGVAGYRIYRDDVAVGSSQTPAYNDTGLTPVTPYCYTISALDGYGNESGQSTPPTCTETANEGSNRYYRDADEDGYGDPEADTLAAVPPSGYVDNNTDCDDTDSAIHPGATEVFDEVDNNCDGRVDEGFSAFYQDSDGDGFGDPNNATQATTQPEGYVADNTDCDDSNPTVHPGAPERPDQLDNDCDGQVDEGIGTYYRDADGDNYGDPNDTVQATSPPGGYVTDNTDCDDADAAVHPGATEVYDQIDNDCDGQVDEGYRTYYRDADGDNYGDPDSATQATTQPDGYVTDHTDCDDSNPTVHPGAPERPDELDNDCDGRVDEGIGTYYRDADGDGYGDPSDTVQATSPPGGYVADNTDCDDTRMAVHPGAAELLDGLDNDCDGAIDEGYSTYFRDADGDGYGNPNDTVQATSPPGGYVADNTDCDDANGAVHPGANEVYDEIDNDCDGQVDEGYRTYFRDADGDGYGNPNDTVQATSPPDGYVADNTDCNDVNAAVHPDADETCNGIDDDCDRSTDEGVQSTYYYDYDQDTYGDAGNTILACSVPEGYVTDSSDCDDRNSAIHPRAEEICYDNIDNNCNGERDEDCPACYPDLASPELEFIGMETVYVNDMQYWAYYLTVTNRSVYPDAMFESSQDYPPCDQEDFGSRTVVEIYDSDGNFVDNICNFTTPDDLRVFSFLVYPGTAPAAVYIDLVDQACDLGYRSNRVSLGLNEPHELYNNGDSLWDGAISITSQFVADDFALASDSRLTGASVDLWYNTRTFDNFTGIVWAIFEDNDGLPGSMIEQGTGTNYASTYIGPHSSGTTHFWKVKFDFGSDISLGAEKRYWLGIRAYKDELSWSDTYASGSNDARSDDGQYWVQDSSPRRNPAFRLFGY
jgi:hypothetical protein